MAVGKRMGAANIAVLVFAILMAFVTLLSSGYSGSPAASFAVIYWGYTAWLIIKRNNTAQVSWQKWMFGFQIFACLVVFLVLTFSDNDAQSLVGLGLTGLVILLGVSLSITGFLYWFFKRQEGRERVRNPIVESGEVADRHWEAAFHELENSRNNAIWAKALVAAGGDSTKARAEYIKLRIGEVAQTRPVVAEVSPTRESRPSIFAGLWGEFWGSFNTLGKICMIAIIGLIGLSIYQSFEDKAQTQNASVGTSRVVEASSISIGRSDPWMVSVNRLSDDIRRGRISARQMRVKSVDDQMAYADSLVSSPFRMVRASDVQIIENQNIWWVNNGRFYVRLYNPTDAGLTSILFSMANGACTGNLALEKWFQFDLSMQPLVAYGHGVYSAEWPFVSGLTLANGGGCGTVRGAAVR